MDPYVFNQDRDLAQQLETMLNRLPGVNITVRYTSAIPKNKKFDAMYAVDFDDLYLDEHPGWNSILTAKEALKQEGRLYIFTGKHIVLDQHGVVDLNGEAEKFVEKLTEGSVRKFLEDSDQINIFISRPERSNFSLPKLASIIQLLSHKYEKPIYIKLYGNEGRLITPYVLKAKNTDILKRLAGVDNLTVEYTNESFRQENATETEYLITEQDYKGDLSYSVKFKMIISGQYAGRPAIPKVRF